MASLITSVNVVSAAVNSRRAKPAGRRFAPPPRAAGDGPSGDTPASSSSDGASTFESPPRRPSPLERIMKDPLAAAVMGPRLALGGATEALDLLQKGQLLGVLAQAPGELNTLMQDPRPINDKAEDLVRRAEGVVETLEERGIAAEAPGREIVRAFVPAELYDRYLDPAAVGAGAPVDPPSASTAYKAEPPPSTPSPTRPAPAEDGDGVVPSKGEGTPATPDATEREDAWVFDSDEDPAVIAAARAVASVLDSEEWDDDREAGLYPEVLGGQQPASTSGEVEEVEASAQEQVEASTPGEVEASAQEQVEASAPEQTPAPPEVTFEAASAVPGAPQVPPELWAAVEEAEKLAADVVMQASTVAAKRGA